MRAGPRSLRSRGQTAALADEGSRRAYSHRFFPDARRMRTRSSERNPHLLCGSLGKSFELFARHRTGSTPRRIRSSAEREPACEAKSTPRNTVDGVARTQVKRFSFEHLRSAQVLSCYDWSVLDLASVRNV